MKIEPTEAQYQLIEQAVADSLAGKGNSQHPENCYGWRNDVFVVGAYGQSGDMAAFSASPIFKEGVDGAQGWRLWISWRDYVVKGNGQRFQRRWSNGVGFDTLPTGNLVRQAVDALVENSNEASDNYPDKHLIPVDKETTMQDPDKRVVSASSEYQQDQAAGNVSFAAQHQSLAEVLIEIAVKAGVSYSGEAIPSYPFTFAGWQVLAEYHQGEFQYLEYFVGPRGEHIDPHSWPDCHDRSRLLAWRPSR